MTDPASGASTDPPTPPVALSPEVERYYATGREDDRLRHGAGRLEFLRTQELLRRLLPPAPLDVADVGGGSGVHARWLEEDGHRVRLVDPVPRHVELAARLCGVRARRGDARALPLPDSSADAVLLLGPLYHLTGRADRVRALAEAVRVLRPGGLVVAATVNRHSALLDQLGNGAYFDPAEREFVDSVCATGRHLRPGGGFWAYLHEPDEIRGEFGDAGLEVRGQYGVEGAAWLMPAVPGRLEDAECRQAVLDALRRTESVPSLLGVSAHLLTAGTA